jgi:hypothetical protein
MVAAYDGHDKCVAALLAKGAAVDAKDNKGSAALAFAAYDGHATCITALLNAGATVDAKDNNGRTALMVAERRGHDECVAALASGGQCVVCLDRPATMVYTCGCIATCLVCAEQAGEKCPICRTEGAPVRTRYPLTRKAARR